MKTIVRGELFRLLRSGAFFIAAAVLTAVLVCLALDYDGRFYYQTGYNGYGIVRYEAEDLPALIAGCEEQIAENERLLAGPLTESEREYLSEETAGLRTQRSVYRFLEKHEIAYADYQDFAGLRDQYGDNAISAFFTFCERLSAVLPLVFSVFAVWMIAWDWLRGTYKFLYSTQVPRKAIAAGRWLAWLAAAAGGSLLCCAAALCLGFLFGGGGGAVVFANASGAFALRLFGVFCLETADILFRTVAVGSLSFGLALLWKIPVFPLLPAAALAVAAPFAYAAAEVSPFLPVLLGGAPYGFLTGGTSVCPVCAALVWEAAAAVCLAVGGLRFVRRDLK